MSITRIPISMLPYLYFQSMAIMMIHQGCVRYLVIQCRGEAHMWQEGHLAALDLLQISGLLNYYGRTPESDNIVIKPVLLQKGQTKLALYGMSNVRDERLFRTFRDGKVKFFQPGTQKQDWFNLMSVHQNQYVFYPKDVFCYGSNRLAVTHIPKQAIYQRTSFLNFLTLWFGATNTNVSWSLNTIQR